MWVCATVGAVHSLAEMPRTKKAAVAAKKRKKVENENAIPHEKFMAYCKAKKDVQSTRNTIASREMEIKQANVKITQTKGKIDELGKVISLAKEDIAEKNRLIAKHKITLKTRIETRKACKITWEAVKPSDSNRVDAHFVLSDLHARFVYGHLFDPIYRENRIACKCFNQTCSTFNRVAAAFMKTCPFYKPITRFSRETCRVSARVCIKHQHGYSSLEMLEMHDSFSPREEIRTYRLIKFENLPKGDLRTVKHNVAFVPIVGRDDGEYAILVQTSLLSTDVWYVGGKMDPVRNKRFLPITKVSIPPDTRTLDQTGSVRLIGAIPVKSWICVSDIRFNLRPSNFDEEGISVRCALDTETMELVVIE